MDIFELDDVRIDGIPCILRVSVRAGSPAITQGPPDNWQPEDPAEVEILGVYDRKGYAAPWLERKIDEMCDREFRNLEGDIFDSVDYMINDYGY